MNRLQWIVGFLSVAGAMLTGHIATAQENNSAALTQMNPSAIVPEVIRYSGSLPGQGQARVSVRFSIYGAATGGSALWSESQNVIPDKDGKYSVLLGSLSSIGLPARVFADGQACWLGIQAAGAEEERTLLASVPFSMKAGDAATLAGKSVSEFATLDQLRAQVAAEVAAQALTSAALRAQPMTTITNPTGSGTTGYLPIWTAAATLGNSAIYQTGSGSGSRAGFGTTAPASTVDVNGQATVRGGLIMQSAAASASTGVNSPFVDLVGSSYSSSAAAAVPQRFRWQVIVSGNDTAAPSASLALGYGTTSASGTGLSISSKGIITFATGQKFPGGSTGTTGTVNASTYDLNGQRFDYGNQSNAFLAYAGNGSAGTGTSNIGVGNAALNKLSSGSSNTALGFATLTNTTYGNSNTAVGSVAMEFNTTGSNNVGVGGAALVRNTTGTGNSAVGESALSNNVYGFYNTALGDSAGPDSASPGLTNTTAVGYGAVVSQSNSLVLGQNTLGKPGTSYVNVGVGTATPASELELSADVEDGMGPVLTLTNGGGTSGASGYHPATTAIDFKTYLHSSTATSPTSRIEAIDNDYGNLLSFFTKDYGSDTAKLIDQVDIGINYAMSVNGYLNVGDGFTISSDPPTIAEFGGSIEVDGSINGTSLVMREDHPLDPANKYLEHASVGSSEQMNLYSGNVTTDSLGLSTVTLPEWFEAENGDFRYQLTAIGRDAHAWVAEEVGNHRFKIATNATFVKVSWQITAVRQSALAKANPLVVERVKPAAEKGFYLHPDLYGQPAEKQLRWAQHPQEMARAKARHAANPVIASGRETKLGGSSQTK